jgi:hypothetical protein
VCLEFGGIEGHFPSNREDHFYSNVKSSDISGDLKNANSIKHVMMYISYVP